MQLSECVKKPALLSIVPGFCDKYIPRSESGCLPKPLTSFFDERLLEASFPQLLDKSEEVFQNITISSEQAKVLEKSTRVQSRSKVWYQQRAGRITGSKFKAAVHTDITKPSQSLIKQICYPESCQFKTHARCWGLENEKRALQEYCAQAKTSHGCFTFSESGLVVNPLLPYLGATPDGIVHCTCCGKGVVEAKCPFKFRSVSFREACNDPNFFLCCSHDSDFTLKTKHAYYYQVQLQMKLCEVDYCEFVVWRPAELVTFRIPADEQFINSAIDKATKLYIKGILPEMLGKWYSKTHHTPEISPTSLLVTSETSSSTTSTDKWCYCQSEEHGTMIGCDNDSCSIGWYHIDCLNIDSIPSGSWYCPECSGNMTKSYLYTVL